MLLEEVLCKIEAEIKELNRAKILLTKYASGLEEEVAHGYVAGRPLITKAAASEKIRLRGESKPKKSPARSPVSSDRGKSKERVRDHIAAHPGCRSSEIAAACNLSESAVGYHLTALKKQGYIKMVGNRTHGITWAPAGKSSSSTDTPPPSAPRRMQSGRPYPELKFSCEACRAKFLTQKQLTAHNQTFHEGKTAGAAKHPCTVCGKVFKDPAELEDHIDLRHPEYSEE